MIQLAKDDERAKIIANQSYLHVLDLNNKHGRSGNVLSKAAYAAEWESVRRHLKIHTYRRTLLTKPDRVVLAKDVLNGNKVKEYLFFASNGYLNLASHPRVIERAYMAMKEWGVSSCASSIIGGKTTIHIEAERKLADYLEMEAAFLFPSGSTANESVLTALARPGDCIIGDNKNHLSINLPCSSLQATSKGRIEYSKYKTDDMKGLKGILKEAEGGKIIITDGVFSMDGDLAPLTELSEMAADHDAWLMMDDAHGFGCLGGTGAGPAPTTAISGRSFDMGMD